MTVNDLWAAASPVVGGLFALWGFLKLAPAAFVERGFGHYLDRKLALLKQEHDEKLQVLKHTHDNEIESLKLDLSHLADRGVRSNEYEYDALVSTWGKFMDAFYATRRCCGGLESIPDFAGMTEEESSAVLSSLEVDPIWQSKILKSKNPGATYLEMRKLAALNEAGSALAVARDTVRRQSVFIPMELDNQIEVAIHSLQAVQSERKVSHQINRPVNGQLCMDLLTEPGEAMFNNLRDAVRNRLLRRDSTISPAKQGTDPPQAPPAPP